jgi:hypothetical protein
MLCGLVYRLAWWLLLVGLLLGLFSLFASDLVRSGMALARLLIWLAMTLISFVLALVLSQRLTVSSSCCSLQATAAVVIFTMYSRSLPPCPASLA